MKRGFPIKQNKKRKKAKWNDDDKMFSPDINMEYFYQKKKKQILKSFVDYACKLFSEWEGNIEIEKEKDSKNLASSLKGHIKY